MIDNGEDILSSCREVGGQRRAAVVRARACRVELERRHKARVKDGCVW